MLTNAPPTPNGKAFLPALTMLVSSVLALAWLSYRPTQLDRPILAFFPPFQAHSAAIRAALTAGARLVSPSPLPFALILQSSQPDFARRLHAAGAWLLLDATTKGFCYLPSRTAH